MSTFVPHLVADLSVKTVPANAPTSSSSEGVQISSTQSKEALRSLFVKLEQSASPEVVRECIGVLQGLEHDQQLLSAGLADGEEHALRRWDASPGTVPIRRAMGMQSSLCARCLSGQ